jgi:putative flippase GtrA
LSCLFEIEINLSNVFSPRASSVNNFKLAKKFFFRKTSQRAQVVFLKCQQFIPIVLRFIFCSSIKSFSPTLANIWDKQF